MFGGEMQRLAWDAVKMRTMAARPHIGILWHPRHFAFMRQKYLIAQHEALWREEGIDVRHFRSAKAARRWSDLVLVHMDVSCIPPRLLDPLDTHPLVLNSRVTDIRKSRISSCLLQRGSDWEGPVIVKTDLNREGAPERLRGVLSGFRGRWWASEDTHYFIYDTVDEVPDWAWEKGAWVVEKHEVEEDPEGFATHSATFFGDEISEVKLSGPNPIVKASNAERCVRLDAVHEAVRRVRVEMGLDYGKIDYTLNDRGAHIFDVNKTIGYIELVEEAESRGQRLTRERLKQRGQVLHRYLSGEIAPFRQSL